MDGGSPTETSSSNIELSHVASTRRHFMQSRKTASALPSLPSLLPAADEDEVDLAFMSPRETSFVEFDMKRVGSDDVLSQKFIRSHSDLSSTLSPTTAPSRISMASPQVKSPAGNTLNRNQTDPLPAEPELDKVELKGNDDDDFFNDKNWKVMSTFTEMDYYNEKGELEFTKDEYDSLGHAAYTQGYTKIDTAEQVAKYAEMDRQTDFLFTTHARTKAPGDKKEYDKEDIALERTDELSDSDFDNDDIVDSMQTLEHTKDMLTEAQRFAYVGIIKLITVDMATDLAKLKLHTSNKIARHLSMGQKNFSNWTLYVLDKLFEHMALLKEENQMIENLSKHGVESNDLTASLLDKSITYHNPNFDIRWVIICDLFLILVSDGYYDSRSRTLLVKFAKLIGIGYIEIHQFERRLIDVLELENKDKSLENDDTKLDDNKFIDRHIKKNRKRRLAYIGLATLGGSLAIGLSMGLLAPVIGAGLAAGFTTIGITGTSSFLAGVGGSAIITTTGVVIGAKVGNKAGKRRAGDVHTFEFKPLHNNKRTNLIITVSGWMNGKLDDVRLPFSTVDPVMGDIFSLLWEPDMLQSMGQTITILASEALTSSIQQILGATILSALMSAIQLPVLLSKLTYLIDNPWSVSLDRAWKAGKILADTLISGNMGVRPITLVGFSLGARLIYSCLIELAKRDCYGLVENVILLGTPVAINNDHLALARSVVSGKYVNGYAKNDWILGYLFRATSGGLSSVAGLSAIEKFGIDDFDCTPFVDGHMSYRSAIPKILKEFGWEVLKDEFVEIEEPDPETNERQRKLLSEFDEARAKMMEEQKNENKKKTWASWFKPKNRSWWEIREKKQNSPGANGNEEGDSNPHEEYDVDGDTPLFDVQQEVNELAHHDLGETVGAALVAEARQHPKTLLNEEKDLFDDSESSTRQSDIVKNNRQKPSAG
ncbi:hypothetical protein DIURU_001065 [Diutina rugosa]|uniref:DUF726-domain-containing protein n=1 Tax=Diutina rugosa TaxID=5481 RepID=A0A642UXC2_DIURU|nr:uncharacterized protein DIURU_001065 [Diutina rugosa]KAA8906327.1 hypothetical protein DIURU_001065 [Diutina rugosa]